MTGTAGPSIACPVAMHTKDTHAPSSPDDSRPDAAQTTDLTRQILAYLQEAATSEFQGEPVAALQQWTGRDNLLWRVVVGADSTSPAEHGQVGLHARQAVVKLFLEAGQARGRRQFDGQSTFAPLGIAPHPFWFDRYPHGLSRQLLVYKWIDGEPLASDDTDALAALAHSVATVHTGEVAQVRRFCPHPINLDYFWRVEHDAIAQASRWTARAGITELSTLLAPLADRATQFVEAAIPLWQGVPPTPVHGDLQPENCLQTPRGPVVLLDWEMYGLGDTAHDVAHLLFHMERNQSTEATAQFLDIYLGMVDQPGLELRIQAYNRLLPLRALAWLLNGMSATLDSLSGAAAPAEGRDAIRAETAQALPFLRAAVGAALITSVQGLETATSHTEIDRALHAWENHMTRHLLRTD